jgi:hypothetical protein
VGQFLDREQSGEAWPFFFGGTGNVRLMQLPPNNVGTQFYLPSIDCSANMPVQVVQFLDWEKGGEMWPLFLRTFLGGGVRQPAAAERSGCRATGNIRVRIHQFFTSSIYCSANMPVQVVQLLNRKKSRKTWPLFLVDTGNV